MAKPKKKRREYTDEEIEAMSDEELEKAANEEFEEVLDSYIEDYKADLLAAVKEYEEKYQ